MILYVSRRGDEPVGYLHTRPNFIVDRLAHLTGPASGLVTLPNRLHWWPNPTYDLDQVDSLRAMYANVLREATSERDLIDYLNPVLLTKHWGQIAMPDYLRTMWHMAHPQLGLDLAC